MVIRMPMATQSVVKVYYVKTGTYFSAKCLLVLYRSNYGVIYLYICCFRLPVYSNVLGIYMV